MIIIIPCTSNMVESLSSIRIVTMEFNSIWPLSAPNRSLPDCRNCRDNRDTDIGSTRSTDNDTDNDIGSTRSSYSSDI